MLDKTDEKLASAMAQGQAQFDSIKEMVEELQRASDEGTDREIERQREEASRVIYEDALSAQVRSGWYTPGCERQKPEEYEILLCTGGPACRIIGRLSEHGEPETARLEVQDWFTPWTKCRPLVEPDNYDSEPILLAYARCFWFGE